MKKQLFSCLLALALALSCIPLAGAAVTSSDAQAYYQAIQAKPSANFYLFDFDGNGTDELLLVWTEWKDYYEANYYEVWSGSKKLVSAAGETSPMGTSLYAARKGGEPNKVYLVDNYGNPNLGFRMKTYTIVSGSWTLVDNFYSSYDYSDEGQSIFLINGQSYDMETFHELYSNHTYSRHPVYNWDYYITRGNVMDQLLQAIDTTLPLKDVLSTLPYADRSALFDHLLCNLTEAGGAYDFRTVSDSDLISLLESMQLCTFFPFDRYGGDSYWEGGCHTQFSQSEFSALTQELFGRTVDYGKRTRYSLPSWDNIEDLYQSFLYQGQFYLMQPQAGDIVGERSDPLHLYQLNGNTYCAVYRHYEIWDDSGDELAGIYSAVVKKNADGTWRAVRIFPNAYVPSADELNAFTQPSSWAKAEVNAAESAGLIPALSGEPAWQDAATRLQFCQLAVQLAETALGEELPAAPAVFSDCQGLAVRKAYAAGIVNGVTESTFAPNNKLTREQLATMLWRAVDYIQTQTGKTALTAGGSLSGFTDAGSVSNYARDAVSALNTHGIMKGTSDTSLSPKNNCTVEQSVLLTYRTFEKIK